jgi:hypothetical protein
MLESLPVWPATIPVTRVPPHRTLPASHAMLLISEP